MPQIPKSRSKEEYYDDDFDDRFDEQYESFDDDEGHEVTYDDYKNSYDEGSCCSPSKLGVFFLFLGLTFGLVFSLVDLDKINNVINNPVDPGPTDGNGNDNSSGGGDSSGGGGPVVTDDGGTDQEPYQFMQCPEEGECCNGLASNCDLLPNEIMWAFVHNANHDDKLIANHEAPLEEALEAGYRGLMLDACLCQNNGVSVFQFCHLSCFIGARDPQEVFTNINTFLINNPTEVVIINFEISHGNPSTSLIWDVIRSSGLRQKTYIHGGGAFPTMRKLLQDGRQLVLAKHRGSDCTNTNSPECTPRIFEYFNHVVETHWDFDNVNEIDTPSLSCEPVRGLNGAKRFYSINQFVTSNLGPSKSAANEINSKASLERKIADCEAFTGYEVNFINVDFWQRGDAVQVVQETNIARARRRRSLITRVINWFYS